MPTLRPMVSLIEPDEDFEAAVRRTISKQMLRKVSGAELVRFKRDQGNQDLGFTSRPFVLCGLPLRRPAPGQLLYERRNGHFVLQVTGHPDYGLPFGQDRVVRSEER